MSQQSFGLELPPRERRVLEAVHDGLDYRFSLMVDCFMLLSTLNACLDRLEAKGLIRFDGERVLPDGPT